MFSEGDMIISGPKKREIITFLRTVFQAVSVSHSFSPEHHQRYCTQITVIAASREVSQLEAFTRMF
jgi:hypothetical protein